MARTTLDGGQITDGSVQRVDLDTTTTGQAVITKIIAGSNVSITSTGVDSGTGDVTINASVSASPLPLTITNTLLSTTGTELTIEQTGDLYGASRFVIENRTGLNGAKFEVDALDLVDFIFSPSSRIVANVRYERRPEYLNNGNVAEFQIGYAGNQWLDVGDVMSTFYKPLNVIGNLTATNINDGGFSNNVAPVKVKKTTTQAINATTNTKVSYNVIEIAPVSAAWVSATNRYVAQTTGVFRVSSTLRTTGTNRSNKLMLYKNGVFIENLQDNNTQTLVTPTYHGSTMIALVATDYLEIWFYTSNAVTVAESIFYVERVY